MAASAPNVLITGGACRVGRAVAIYLAEKGFDIAFTYLSSKPAATSLVRLIEKKKRRCLAICADLTDPDAPRQLAAELSSQFPHLNLLLNNASLFIPDNLQHYDPQAAMKMWALHVQAPVLLSQLCAGLLKKRQGAIVNMIDLLAMRPWPQYLSYCASKAALANLTLSLARQLAPRVRVIGIAPGVVAWPEDMPLTERKQYLQRVPLRRPGTPRDVAQLVHFLATDGGYITGEIIRLDGGRWLT